MSLTSQTPDVIYEYVVGDNLSTPRAVIKNLVSTGYVFTLRILLSDGTTLVKAGTIIDDGSTSGDTTVDFPLLTTDLIEGTHTGQMKYTTPGGDIQTFVQDAEFRVGAAV